MRRLALLFLAVIVPVAGTLIWLGVKTLDEDRVEWERQKDEGRKSRIESAVQSLDHSLTEVERALVDPLPLPEGAVKVTIADGDVHATPAGRVLWLPAVRELQEVGKEPFRDVDIAEARGAADLVGLRAFVASDAPAVRAGAYLRLARISRNAGNWNDAIANYRNLAAIHELAIEGAPVDLVARRAICDVLVASGRKAEVEREAEALESDLLAGKWEMDSAEWDGTTERLESWLGRTIAITPERMELSEAVDWFYEWRATIKPSGRTAKIVEPALITLVWRKSGTQTMLIALPQRVTESWAESLNMSLIPHPQGDLPWGVSQSPWRFLNDA